MRVKNNFRSVSFLHLGVGDEKKIVLGVFG